jgi:hypothetical protein
VDKLNLTFQTYANVVLRPNLFALWAVDEWFPFSNHSAFGKNTEDESKRYGWYTSIEVSWSLKQTEWRKKLQDFETR